MSDLTCDRCHRSLPNATPPANPFTAGYYLIGFLWSQFADPGEHVVCDRCMHADPRYIRTYGTGTRAR